MVAAAGAMWTLVSSSTKENVDFNIRHLLGEITLSNSLSVFVPARIFTFGLHSVTMTANETIIPHNYISDYTPPHKRWVYHTTA